MRTASSRREVLAVADPVSEEVRLDRRVRHLAHVRAGVGEAHDRVRVGEAAHGPVVVERCERLPEELAHVGLERELDHRLDRVHTPLGGDLGDCRVRRQRRVEHLHAVELGRAGLAAERLAVGALVGDLHEPGDDVRVVRVAAVAPRPGSARSSRHSGRRSKGSLRAERRERADAARVGQHPTMRAPARRPMRRGWRAPGVVHRR